MAIPLNPNQLISSEELLMSQVIQQKALARLLIPVTHNERIIHQRGVFGDGEGGG